LKNGLDFGIIYEDICHLRFDKLTALSKVEGRTDRKAKAIITCFAEFYFRLWRQDTTWGIPLWFAAAGEAKCNKALQKWDTTWGIPLWYVFSPLPPG
jgi:hypothetical protein